MEIKVDDDFFDRLIEVAKNNIKKKWLSKDERIELLLDYLDTSYNFYRSTCPLKELNINSDNIDICDNNMCNTDGSKKCWLY